MPLPSQQYTRQPDNMDRLPAETREIVHDGFTAAALVMLDALRWNKEFSGTVTVEYKNGECAKVKPSFTL